MNDIARLNHLQFLFNNVGWQNKEPGKQLNSARFQPKQN